MSVKLEQLLARYSADNWVEFADIVAIPLLAGGYRCYCKEANALQYIGKLPSARGKVYRLSDIRS
jgi:hypothetical protein